MIGIFGINCENVNIGNIVKIVQIGNLKTFVFSTKFLEDAKRIYLSKFITVCP